MGTTNNQQEEIKTEEAVFVLRRAMTRSKHRILCVSRSLEVNGKVIYSDNITREMFYSTLDNPDVFGCVELFSTGDISINIRKHTTGRSKYGKNIVELFKRIWLKFGLDKLHLRIKLFKLYFKHNLLCRKCST